MVTSLISRRTDSFKNIKATTDLSNILSPSIEFFIRLCLCLWSSKYLTLELVAISRLHQRSFFMDSPINISQKMLEL